MSTTKLLVGLGLGAGALVGFNYFRKLQLTDQHMEIIPSAMIHKLDLTGLFNDLHKHYPHKSFIFILQTTKDGNFRGANSFHSQILLQDGCGD